MSPEYAIEGLFSEKSDVFSFGVLLLEIISGKKNTSFFHRENSLSLSGFVSFSKPIYGRNFRTAQLIVDVLCCYWFAACLFSALGMEIVEWRRHCLSHWPGYIGAKLCQWDCEMHTHWPSMCARTCKRQTFYGNYNFNA